MATDNKYDRQLRLWGSHGQKILSSSTILVLGASSSACETLKNLILPQIKKFIVVDDQKITLRDLGQNFFYNQSDLGRQKSKIMCENLHELNPEDVQYEFIQKSVKDFIADQSIDWNQYSLVIASDVDNILALEISKKCSIMNQDKIPFILIRQYGLIGYIRIILDEVCVAEQKPYQVEMKDLRLNQPFEELVNFANSIDLNSLELNVHSHVPYVVILLQAAVKWKENHQNKMPSNFKEKNEFKDFIKTLAKDPSKELNFDEAIKNAHLFYKDLELPENVQKIFDSEKIKDQQSTNQFWVSCQIIKQFYEKNKRLPISGSVPDMISTTEYYLEIQKIYQEQSKDDLTKCIQMLKDYYDNLQDKKYSFDEYVESLEISCKNANYLEITSLNPFEQDLKDDYFPEDFQDDLHNEESCNAWFVALKAVEKFRIAHKHYPGQTISIDDSLAETFYSEEIDQEHVKWLQTEIDKSVQQLTPDENLDQKYAFEMVRFSDTKIHSMSAFLGGVASQEIIKILIKQYTIMNSTFIYDGIHGRAQVFQ